MWNTLQISILRYSNIETALQNVFEVVVKVTTVHTKKYGVDPCSHYKLCNIDIKTMEYSVF